MKYQEAPAHRGKSRILNHPRKFAICRWLWILFLCSRSLAIAAGPSPQPPEILLAKVFSTATDPAHYWVSEKYDGVRAIWDGHALRFRSGRPVPAPSWFLAELPAQALDGELWLGRGRFDELSAIVRQTEPQDADWRQVKYMIFELPGAPGSFTERIAQMATIVRNSVLPNLEVAPQFRVANHRELANRLAAIVKVGGEGLMLHRADASYRTGRGDDLLKLKPWQDAEATVVAHLPGHGRLAGLTGALLMEMPDGKRFRLGSGLGAAEQRNPPSLGSRLTYRYQELTARGLPRFPRYWRTREDF
ncbi:DNA ligase [Rhodocyclaceae bacterium]